MSDKPSTMRFVAKPELEQAIKSYCEQQSEVTGERVTYAEVTRQMWAERLGNPELADGHRAGRPSLKPE